MSLAGGLVVVVISFKPKDQESPRKENYLAPLFSLTALWGEKKVQSPSTDFQSGSQIINSLATVIGSKVTRISWQDIFLFLKVASSGNVVSLTCIHDYLLLFLLVLTTSCQSPYPW